jgi:hypothetical protein
MIDIVAKCDRCSRQREVTVCTYKSRELFLCAECAPHLEVFGARFLREEHYASRSGFIYGAPWWEFNTISEEDAVWEHDTFGDDAIKPGG